MTVPSLFRVDQKHCNFEIGAALCLSYKFPSLKENGVSVLLVVQRTKIDLKLCNQESHFVPPPLNRPVEVLIFRLNYA